VLYKRVMAEESPPGIFLFVSEWVVTALLPALFLPEVLCCISPSIIYKISQFYCSLLPILVTFLPSCVQCCQMLSGNQFILNLNTSSFSCKPHVLLLISLVDPCSICALLAVISSLPNVWKFLWLLFLFGFCTWLLST